MSAARDELFHGLFTTALEGGIGYWSVCEYYRWSVNGSGVDDLAGFSATIVDAESDDNDDAKAYQIDRKVIAKGYKLATTTYRDRISWSSDKPPLVITDDTDWDYDAFDADVIVQLGLFGDVIYG